MTHWMLFALLAPPATAGTSSYTPTCSTTRAHPDIGIFCTFGVAAFDEAGMSYSTLNAAFNNASSIDNVYVCPGTYPVQDVTVSRTDLTIAAASGRAADTIIDGGGNGIMTFDDADIVLFNLTFQNASRNNGGAIRSGVTDLRVNCSEFEDNTSSSSGGAIYFTEGLLTIESSEFYSNTADVNGGAISVGGDQPSQVQIIDSIFEENSALSQGGTLWMGEPGRGVVGAGEKLIIAASFFDNDDSPTANAQQGGVIYMYTESWVEVDIIDTQFEAAAASDEGGIFYFDGDGASEFDIWFENSLLSESTATNGAALVIAESVNDADIDLVASDITLNQTDPEGAAVVFGESTFMYSNNTNWGFFGAGDDNEDFDMIGFCETTDTLGAIETFQCFPGIEGIIR